MFSGRFDQAKHKQRIAAVQTHAVTDSSLFPVHPSVSNPPVPSTNRTIRIRPVHDLNNNENKNNNKNTRTPSVVP